MKKRLAPILSAAVLTVCLIYPIILQKPFDKGEEMSLYEVILRDLDEQLGIARYDITWNDIFQYNDTFRFVQDKPLPAVHIYGDGNHTVITDYLTEHIKPITVYGNPSRKDHNIDIDNLSFGGTYGETRPLGKFQRKDIEFRVYINAADGFEAVRVRYDDGDGGEYEVYYDLVK